MAIMPRSVARWYDPFVTAAVTIAVFLALKSSNLSDRDLVLVVLAAVTLPMFLFEWIRQRSTLAPAPASTPSELLERCAIKWLGVMVVTGLMLFFWWLFPLYQDPYFRPAMDLRYVALPYFALVLVPYILFTEWRLGAANDYAWHFGLLALGRWKTVDWISLRDGTLSMVIRAIFLPINFCTMVGSIMPDMRHTRWETALDITPASFTLIAHALYALLIIAILPGYIFSLRLLNTHTRAIDHSWLGWATLLICYKPLHAGVVAWLKYHPLKNALPAGTQAWAFLFHDNLTLMFLVGSGIVLSELIHWWGESILGIRSSNITHRGIITNGPFRLLRHPVYFGKCVGWFLIAMPMLMGDTALESLRLTMLFGFTCLIFYLRSIVEERLLSCDPDYVTYALWMDKHGLLSFVGRWCPIFTFDWRHRHFHR
jgi:protein-S-isoprenylcysteine O-methyltransferase Ste14